MSKQHSLRFLLLAIAICAPLSLQILSENENVVFAQGLQCIDTDGGQATDRAGFAAIKGAEPGYLSQKADYCAGDTLMEQYCDSAQMKEVAIPCQFGCADGECNQTGTKKAVSSRRKAQAERRAGVRTGASIFKTTVQRAQRNRAALRGASRKLVVPWARKSTINYAPQKKLIQAPVRRVPARCERLSIERRKRVHACNQ